MDRTRLGVLIAEYRKKAGLTQEKFIATIEHQVSISTLQRIESGATSVKLENIFTVLGAFPEEDMEAIIDELGDRSFKKQLMQLSSENQKQRITDASPIQDIFALVSAIPLFAPDEFYKTIQYICSRDVLEEEDFIEPLIKLYKTLPAGLAKEYVEWNIQNSFLTKTKLPKWWEAARKEYKDLCSKRISQIRNRKDITIG